MVDIMKLEGDLKTGKLEAFDGKKATLITPVFRLRFAVLGTPADYKDDGRYRYRIKMLFNGAKPDQPALVDLKSVLGTTLAKVAAAHSLNLAARGGDANPFSQGIAEDANGEPYAGFEEWTYSATASKHPSKNQAHTDPRFRVQCVSGSGQPADPSDFYDGCYCRAMIDIYKAGKHPKLACGLKWIQFVANGERLGGAMDDTNYEVPGIPGAEDVATPDADYPDDGGVPF